MPSFKYYYFAVWCFVCCPFYNLCCLYSGFNKHFDPIEDPKIPVYDIESSTFSLAGLFPISHGLELLNPFSGLQNSMAFLYAIYSINSDDSILPNVTLAYQLRDVMFSLTKSLFAGIDALENHITIVIGDGLILTYIYRSYDLEASEVSL